MSYEPPPPDASQGTHPQDRPDPDRSGLWVGVILLVLAVGAIGAVQRWAREVILGRPVPVTADTLRNLNDPKDLSSRWVTFTAESVVDTNLALSKKKADGNEPQMKFVLVQIGDRWAVASVPLNFREKQIIGFVDKPAGATADHMDEIRRRYPDRQFVPYEIDASADQRENATVVSVLILVLLVLPGIGLVVAGIRLRRFEAAERK